MKGNHFKRYGRGILYIVGNGRVIHFDKEKIEEMHTMIHEWEKNPEDIIGVSLKTRGEGID